jgi:putative FmdB family regulatory protein
MPTYEYQCDACNHKFDELQSMSDAPLKKCPKCKKKKLRRLFGTGAAILFKGSGFYQTDYRSEAYKTSANADQQKASAEADKSGATGKVDSSANGATGETGKSKSEKPKSSS